MPYARLCSKTTTLCHALRYPLVWRRPQEGQGVITDTGKGSRDASCSGAPESRPPSRGESAFRALHGRVPESCGFHAAYAADALSKSPPTRAHVLDVKPAIQLFTRDDDCRRLIVTSSGLMSALIAPLLYSEQRCSVHNNRLTRACIQSGLMTVRGGSPQIVHVVVKPDALAAVAATLSAMSTTRTTCAGSRRKRV